MATANSTLGLPSGQLRINGLQRIFQHWKRICVDRNLMPNNSVMSGTLEARSYQSAYMSSLDEQIIRLRSMVAYLLGKNEQLRQVIAAQSEKE